MTEPTPGLPEWQVSPTPPEELRSHVLDLKFTGSGSEYFRIWIVNLLLILLTLGLYYPWAKVRRLRYFMGNTLVGGQALGFHGKPWKMFKGYVLVAILFGLYSVAGKLSATAGLTALLIVAALWPALFKSSMQFRLANTSWRGLRLRFHGDLAGAYRAMLPVFVPAVFFVGALVFVPNRQAPPLWYGYMSIAVGLLTLAVAPWVLWNLKQYQHNHYGLGYLQTSFQATAGSFYKLSLKVFGIGLLLFGVPMAVFGVMAATQFGRGPVQPGQGSMLALASLLPLLGMLVIVVGVRAYAVARMQNLVWAQTGTSSSDLQFDSTLRVGALMWRIAKNLFLTVITLGLYWPFAAVAMTRLRLEAVQIQSRNDPEQWVCEVQGSEGETAGDAAGDFFGLDVGL